MEWLGKRQDKHRRKRNERKCKGKDIARADGKMEVGNRNEDEGGAKGTARRKKLRRQK